MSMTSHELADQLQILADWLKSKPEFKTATAQPWLLLSEFYDKDTFLAAVRAAKPGTKGDGFDHETLRFTPNTGSTVRFNLDIKRDKICTLITPAQPAVYDCTPMLADHEEAELTA